MCISILLANGCNDTTYEVLFSSIVVLVIHPRTILTKAVSSGTSLGRDFASDLLLIFDDIAGVIHLPTKCNMDTATARHASQVFWDTAWETPNFPSPIPWVRRLGFTLLFRP